MRSGHQVILVVEQGPIPAMTLEVRQDQGHTLAK